MRPLARGGWEHESNLVPACMSCNCSKNVSLLTAWRPDRVAYGVAHSLKVASEYMALLAVVFAEDVDPGQAEDDDLFTGIGEDEEDVWPR